MKKKEDEIILHLIDTKGEILINNYSGKKEKSDISERYYSNADCIIMGIDLTNKQSFEEIINY